MGWIVDGVGGGRVTRISWEFICGKKQREVKENLIFGLKIPGNRKSQEGIH